jgi:hypothetical protein
MKKFLVTILALVYIASSVGAAVQLQCCQNNLVAWSVSKSTDDTYCSAVCTGCCQDDHKQSKLANDQKFNEANIRLAKATAVPVISVFSNYSFHSISSQTLAYPVSNAPPQQSAIPLFILNCVYRI